MNAFVHFISETLAVVAQFIGADNFKPLANDTLQLALKILDETDDPDIRKSVYALFAALSIVMKDEISPALPKIVEQMIDTIQSSEGIVVSINICPSCWILKIYCIFLTKLC